MPAALGADIEGGMIVDSFFQLHQLRSQMVALQMVKQLVAVRVFLRRRRPGNLSGRNPRSDATARNA